MEKPSARLEIDEFTHSLLLPHDGLCYPRTFLEEQEYHSICWMSVEMATFLLTGRDAGQGRIEVQASCWEGRPSQPHFSRTPLPILQPQNFLPPHGKVAESCNSRKLSMVPEKSLFLILTCNRALSPVEIFINCLSPVSTVLLFLIITNL